MAWERRGAYRVLLGESEGKRPLGRPTRRWEDNVKLSEMVGMDWIDLVLDRNSWQALVNAIMNIWIPLHEGKLLTISGRISLSRRTAQGLSNNIVEAHTCEAEANLSPLNRASLYGTYMVIHLRKLSNFLGIILWAVKYHGIRVKVFFGSRKNYG